MSENRKLKTAEKPPGEDNSVLVLIAIGLFVLLAPSLIHPLRNYLIWLFFRYRIYGLAFVMSFSSVGILYWVMNWRMDEEEEVEKEQSFESEFKIGVDQKTGETVHLLTAQRLTHMQIIGTTNAGKTSGVILPMCIHDIRVGNGLVMIDGKAERTLLDQIYSYATELGRKGDVQIFSLANPAISRTYNPFLRGNAEQITERFFSTLTLENQYYKDEQIRIFRTVVSVILKRGEPALPLLIREGIRNRDFLGGMAAGLNDPLILSDLDLILKGSEVDYQKSVSAILSALSLFCSPGVSSLFNQVNSEIDLKHVYRGRGIVYFQLPTLMYQNLGPMVGRMIIAEIKQILSEQQMASTKNPVPIFPLYLDDFNDYLDAGFESVLNKLRSAGLAAVLSHQSLSDLAKVSPEFKEGVLVNTNVKFFMRGSHPETNDYVANFLGTRTVEKKTSRASTEKTLFGRTEEVDTGERSVRETEEYIVHPNEMKNRFGLWEGCLVVPERDGRKIYEKIKVTPVPTLPALSLPVRELLPQSHLPIVERWMKTVEQAEAQKTGAQVISLNASKVFHLKPIQKESEKKENETSKK